MHEGIINPESSIKKPINGVCEKSMHSGFMIDNLLKGGGGSAVDDLESDLSEVGDLVDFVTKD